jgi:hypothetical protein
LFLGQEILRFNSFFTEWFFVAVSLLSPYLCVPTFLFFPVPFGHLWQGDQIGRIFAHWAFVYFGQFLNITKVAQSFGLPFPRKKK